MRLQVDEKQTREHLRLGSRLYRQSDDWRKIAIALIIPRSMSAMAWSRHLTSLCPKLGRDCRECHQMPRCLRNILPRKSCARCGLFVPQRDHWIDAHGAARGNVACRDRD